MKEFNVTPWEVSGDIDYEKLVKRFGVFSLRGLLSIFNADVLFRRKII
ncbi:hypothetical protein KAJ87_03815 [Candidatus Pacearchaeota archaeon]|nr:hypothetical protein [Candidatus Pacearchaeota archaeon]